MNVTSLDDRYDGIILMRSLCVNKFVDEVGSFEAALMIVIVKRIEFVIDICVKGNALSFEKRHLRANGEVKK